MRHLGRGPPAHSARTAGVQLVASLTFASSAPGSRRGGEPALPTRAMKLMSAAA